jgi:hypothetical protein
LCLSGVVTTSPNRSLNVVSREANGKPLTRKHAKVNYGGGLLLPEACASLYPSWV